MRSRRTDTLARRDRRREAIAAWLELARRHALHEHSHELEQLTRSQRRHLLDGRAPPTAAVLASIPSWLSADYLEALRLRVVGSSSGGRASHG